MEDQGRTKVLDYFFWFAILRYPRETHICITTAGWIAFGRHERQKKLKITKPGPSAWQPRAWSPSVRHGRIWGFHVFGGVLWETVNTVYITILPQHMQASRREARVAGWFGCTWFTECLDTAAHLCW